MADAPQPLGEVLRNLLDGLTLSASATSTDSDRGEKCPSDTATALARPDLAERWTRSCAQPVTRSDPFSERCTGDVAYGRDGRGYEFVVEGCRECLRRTTDAPAPLDVLAREALACNGADDGMRAMQARKLAGQLRIDPVEDADNGAAHQRLRAWLADPDSVPAVLLVGPPGTGKSFLGLHYLVRAIKQHVRAGAYVEEWAAYELWRAAQCGDASAEALWSKLARVPFLHFADLGAKADMTPKGVTGIAELLGTRFELGLPTIVDTNVQPATHRLPDGTRAATLADLRGERLFSRLRGVLGGSYTQVLGRDRRAIRRVA